VPTGITGAAVGTSGDLGTPVVDAPVTADGSSGQVAGTPRRASSSVVDTPVDLSDIYLTFVLVAGAALASMTILRLLGVRTLWNS